jgi:hypothetical protein
MVSILVRDGFVANLSDSGCGDCMNITLIKPPELPRTCGLKMDLMKVERQEVSQLDLRKRRAIYNKRKNADSIL